MKRPLVIANWKMNTDLASASILATAIKNGVHEYDRVEVVLCPPFVWLVPVAEALGKVFGKIKLGAQNMFSENKGAYTGEISPVMLKKLVKYVILGHSERRKYLGEGVELINKKIKMAIEVGLYPIACVGEEKKEKLEKDEFDRENEINNKSEIIKELSRLLNGISAFEMENVVLAYEPVWAISTSSNPEVATGAYAAAVITGIRKELSQMYNKKVAVETRILYGGSVDAKNAAEFLHQPEIDGVLVGGASLKVREFVGICQEASHKK